MINIVAKRRLRFGSQIQALAKRVPPLRERVPQTLGSQTRVSLELGSPALAPRSSAIVRQSTRLQAMIGFASFAICFGTSICVAHADLMLDVTDVTVRPGESSSFDINVEARRPTSVLGWDTELVLDAKGPWIDVTSVEIVGGQLQSRLAGFRANYGNGRLQTNAFTSTTAPFELTSLAGPTLLFRVNFDVEPTTPVGSQIAVRFSPREFTNFVDANVQPIDVDRTGGTITVSAVPEPSAFALGGIVCTLCMAASRCGRRSR